MPGFDLSTLDPSRTAPEGAVLTVEHPVTLAPLTYTDDTGAEQPVTITLLGLDSAEARAVIRQQQNRRLKQRRVSATAEDMERDGLDVLATITVAWDGVSLGGPDALACTHANALKVYSTFGWLRRQVDQFVGDAGNFLGSAVTPSSPSLDTSGG